MPSCAEYLAESLWQLGTRRVFGLPGGENVQVLDALRRRGFEFVLVRNESSAAYAAAACWRLTGIPQACLTTLGPGATHAAAGIGHLWLDRAAVAVITARTAEQSGPLHTHQVLDLTRLLAPLTKSSFTVLPETAHQIPIVCSLMTEGRPGPVHLQISNETAGQPLSGEALSPAFPVQSPPKGTAAQDLARAVSLLQEADRPVLIAGLGIMDDSTAQAAVALAEMLQAPVIVTPKAKGVIAASHPLAAGVMGLTRTDPVYAILETADTVVAIGFDVVELVKPWDSPQPLIWIADWPNRDPRLPAALELEGDMAGTLSHLASRMTPAAGWQAFDMKGFRQRHASAPPAATVPGTVSPQHLLRALYRHVEDDALLLVDVGSHKIYFSLDWPAWHRGDFLLSNGLSCMGYGLAGAIGAGKVDPDRQIICVIGDGGLAMCAGELGLLCEIGGNIKVVVVQDQALDLIRAAQLKAGRPPVGTEYSAATNHVALAQAFGLPALRAVDDHTLEQALQTALATQTPFLVEVMLDPASYPTAAARNADAVQA